MNENLEKNINLIVVKRDGKKVDFNGAKVALAIKKGFDSVNPDDEQLAKYTEKDVHKVYNLVIEKLEKWDKDRIKIEEIQDIIEEELKNKGYEDVYNSFASYRERRNQSRQLFFDEKQQHKFLKALENLGMKSSVEDDSKRENANVDRRYCDGNDASIWKHSF